MQLKVGLGIFMKTTSGGGVCGRRANFPHVGHHVPLHESELESLSLGCICPQERLQAYRKYECRGKPLIEILDDEADWRL